MMFFSVLFLAFLISSWNAGEVQSCLYTNLITSYSSSLIVSGKDGAASVTNGVVEVHSDLSQGSDPTTAWVNVQTEGLADCTSNCYLSFQVLSLEYPSGGGYPGSGITIGMKDSTGAYSFLQLGISFSDITFHNGCTTVGPTCPLQPTVTSLSAPLTNKTTIFTVVWNRVGTTVNWFANGVALYNFETPFQTVFLYVEVIGSKAYNLNFGTDTCSIDSGHGNLPVTPTAASPTVSGSKTTMNMDHKTIIFLIFLCLSCSLMSLF